MDIVEFFKRKRTRRVVYDAESLFQIREHGGELWLTYAGCLVCPCTMLRDAPVDAVTNMRTMYVKRRTKQS